MPDLPFLSRSSSAPDADEGPILPGEQRAGEEFIRHLGDRAQASGDPLEDRNTSAADVAASELSAEQPFVATGADATPSSGSPDTPAIPERHAATALIENDIGRIPTPPPSVVAPYRDPTNLPPATGASHAFGHDWVHFGSGVSVHKEYLTEHQELRQVIASTPEGQDHLAHQERTPGMHVWVTPYSAYTDRPRVEHLESFLAIPRKQKTHIPSVTLDFGSIDGRPVVPPPTLKRKMMAYAVDQGKLENTGQLSPPVIAGAHEWAHVARADKFGTHPAGTIPAGRMGDGEEDAAVAFQNLTAKAINAGHYDSYEHSARYRTGGVSSATPVNPDVRAAIQTFQPRLKEATDKLTNAGADPRNPTEEHESLYRKRQRLVDRMDVALQRADPPRTG